MNGSCLKGKASCFIPILFQLLVLNQDQVKFYVVSVLFSLNDFWVIFRTVSLFLQIFDHNNRSLGSFLPRIISSGEHGKSWIWLNCFKNSFFFYTHVDNTERAREMNLVARKI